MSQKPRNQIIYDGCLFHVAWKCHNNNWLLKDERLKSLYYEILHRYQERYVMNIHAYHFMENHIHLIGRTKSVRSFSDFFRVVHNLFARQVNHRMRRRGQVVMERLKSPAIHDERHLLTAMTYLDLNGVRAGRDNKPEDSRWSSYRYYAYGKPDSLVLPVSSYIALAELPERRQRLYRSMVEGMMK